jgi:AcrR family transcriptional regulator
VIGTPGQAPNKITRGPQADQSARTRAKLLNATVECLYHFGYDRTTTVLVVERAGVARGSLLHQFPTKVDLMVATINYIASLRALAHREGLKGVTRGPERFERLIEILWQEMSSPSGIARLEILLASRGDHELAEKLAPIEADLQRGRVAGIWRFAEQLGITDRNLVESMAQLYVAALRGLSVDALFPSSREHVLSAVALLKQSMMSLLLDAIARGAASSSESVKKR